MLAKDAPDPTNMLLQSMRSNEANADDSGPGETALGRVVIRDFANYRVFDRLGLYERRIEYSLYRTMNELQKLRLVREHDESTHAARGIAKEGTHRQSFDGLRRGAATRSTPEPAARTEEEPLRQTKPISPLSAPKPRFEGQGKANQSHFPGVRTGPGGESQRQRGGQAVQWLARDCGTLGSKPSEALTDRKESLR